MIVLGRVFGLCVICACVVSQASADTVILKNGDRISGTGCSVADKTVTITTELYLKLSVVDAYDSTPPEGTKRNDVSLISFLGVSF